MKAYALLIAAACACRTEDVLAPLSLEELRAAPLSIGHNEQMLVLEPYVWRDFQPVAPPDGQPMIAVLRVRTSDSTALPTSVRVETAWVIMGNEVWTAAASEEGRGSPTPAFYEAVIHNGPKWGPGISVEVVVRVQGANGFTALLRAASVPVHRTS